MSDELRQVMGEIKKQMDQFHVLLENRAQEIQVSGGDPEIGPKLIKGADAMRDSGNIYLSWAKHYVGLSEGEASESEEGEEDSPDFQF